MPPTPTSSRLAATFAARSGRTEIARLHESGALRLRRARGAVCEASLVNTGGGILGGDRLSLEMTLEPAASATITSVAAEKVYRAEGPAATLATRLSLAGAARLDWLPQETILFDGARLDRHFEVAMAVDATLLVAETLVFGRLASAETSIVGALRDGWRVRRAGELVFADATWIEGAIGATLDRPAVAGGARATTLVLMLGPEAEARLEPARAALAAFPSVEGGASTRPRLLSMRLLSRDPERLRAATIAVLGVLRGAPPRGWC